MIHNVFVDSDVIISSLISTNGAAHLLISHLNPQFYYSNIQTKELKVVCERLKIPQKNLEKILQHLSQINIHNDDDCYFDFVHDPNDSHILAGAHQSSAKFLITYNQKDFRVEKIKLKFKIIVLTPALYLQYLRSVV